MEKSEVHNNSEYIKLVSFLFFFMVLSILPAIRPIGIDRDSENYANSIKGVAEKKEVNIFNSGKEPFYFLIINIAKILFVDPVRGTFAIFAFVSVFIKLLSIYKYSDNIFLSIMLYLGFFYILQEFNTIRSGAATAIFLLSYNDLKNKNALQFLIKIGIATLFHYSAIILVVFYLINFEVIKKNIFILILITFILDIFKINKILIEIAANISPAFISYKLNIYLNMLNNGLFSKVSTQRLLFNIGLFLLFLFFKTKKMEKILEKDKEIEILVNIIGLSIILFNFFKFLPVISSRISETSSIFIVLLLPKLIKYFNKYERPLILCLLFYLLLGLIRLYMKSYFPIF